MTAGHSGDKTARGLWASLAACMAMLMMAFTPSEAATSPVTLDWVSEHRMEIAKDLVRPISRCVARKDSEHPAFHGCWDWHSSVHGTWALIAYTRMTGDEQYVPLIRATLAADKIAQERKNLAAKPDFEMPYGRAWFLRLVIDYERWSGGTELKAFGDEVAQSLIAHYAATPPDPYSEEYASASWALRNLHDYARHRGDKEMVARVRNHIYGRFLMKGTVCDPMEERGGFMAVCTNWAALVGRMLTQEEFAVWLKGFLPDPSKLVPVTDPRNAHDYGLNFSRAWGLLDLYRLTGDKVWADLYAAHFHTAYADPQNWDGEYKVVAHWVAQFGMYALQPLYGAEAGRP